MREALLLSMRLHALWVFEALDVRGRYLSPLHPRRLLILFVMYPLYLILQGIHWLGFLLDEMFFRHYKDVVVKEPLIVTGIPSSGTTFVLHALSCASNQFTTFRTWEALLAPSITERKAIQWLADLDNKLASRPLHKLVDWIDNKLANAHPRLRAEGLQAPAEDGLALLPIGACFSMVLAFPASRSLWQLGRFQEMTDDQKQTIMHVYKACLQKHLYWAGPQKRLLSVNTAFGSWLPDLRFAFPDARYLFCIREPGPALSSQLSSIRPGLKFFGTTRAADTYSLELQTVFAHVYRILLKEKRSFLIDHLAVMDHASLEMDSGTELRKALKQLCVTIDPEMEEILRQAGGLLRQHTSGHRQEPLGAKSGPDEFNTLVGSIYREILEHPYMTPDDRR